MFKQKSNKKLSPKKENQRQIEELTQNLELRKKILETTLTSMEEKNKAYLLTGGIFSVILFLIIGLCSHLHEKFSDRSLLVGDDLTMIAIPVLPFMLAVTAYIFDSKQLNGSKRSYVPRIPIIN